MRIFFMEAEGDIGAQIATQLIDHGQVVGAHGPHRNVGRVRGLSAEPAALGQPACVRPRIVGCF